MSASSQLNVSPGGALRGTIRVPGDKSISHRALMLGSIAEGTTCVHGFLEGQDALATMSAFRSMGVHIEVPNAGEVRIEGVGKHGLRVPAKLIDLGNSGTAMRLMAGLLAGQNFQCILTGDESLNSRPMARVCQPLTQMGARLETGSGGRPPLLIRPVLDELTGINYEMPMASAQVKSSLLLAGLYANGRTCVSEPACTRDHTERMLRAFGYEVTIEDSRVCLEGGGTLLGNDVDVPGDFSSAAFFLVGASIAKGSDLIIESVGVNPTRTGALEILRLMGADISVVNEREMGAEPVADLRVRHSELHGINVPRELVALAIDEFPILFIAAACARGRTVVSGAHELRVKESDRIDAMAQGLTSLGLQAHPTRDGLIVEGGPISGGTINSRGDHRIAMAFSMSGLLASEEIVVNDCNNIHTSFPGFVQTARRAGLHVAQTHG